MNKHECASRQRQVRIFLAVGCFIPASFFHTAAWAGYSPIYVELVPGTNNITTTPSLYKSSVQTPANLVTTIDDVPLGIRHSAWGQDTGSRGDLYVYLRPGRYKLERSWTWTQQESGRSDSKLYIRAEVPGQAIIEGSKTLTVPASVHQGVASYAHQLSGAQPFEQLWVNERRAVRARTPNVGSFAYVQDPVTSWGGVYVNPNQTPAPTPVDAQAFVSESSVLNAFSGLGVDEKSDAVVVIAHAWSTGHHRLAAIDDARKELTISPPALRRFLAYDFGAAQRYFIENVPSALDDDREWFRSRTGELTYRPSGQEKQDALRFDMPRTDIPNLVTVQGTSATSAAYIHFGGLAFRYAGAQISAAGFLDRQAAVLPDIPAAIQIDNAHHIEFTHCEVSRVGGYAFWFRDKVTDSRVANCDIYDTGAGGIKIGQNPTPGITGFTGSQRNTVASNRIYSIGHQFPGGVGVWIGKSPYNLVEDNLIKDATYSGISVGWVWRESDPDAGVSQSAAGNTIRRNLLVDVMQGLSDGAGIYTLGGTNGTTVTGNVIKNALGFSSYGAGAHGIYNDQGSNYITVAGNIAYNTRSGGYNFHLANAISLEDNAFGPGMLGEMTVITSGAPMGSTALRNYFFPKVRQFVRNASNGAGLQFTYNDGGAPNKVSTQEYAFGGSLTSVECLKSAADCVLDTTLTIDPGATLLSQPVLKSGGTPFSLPRQQPPSFLGTTFADVPSPAATWKTDDADVERRRFFLDVNDTDNYPDNATPAYLKVLARNASESVDYNEKHRDWVSVQSFTLPGGATERCLKFSDFANLHSSAMPVAIAMTNYDTGTSTVKFRMKGNDKTRFTHQWRDTDANWFNAGPTMSFVGGPGGVAINANGQVVATSQLNQWFEVEVTSSQGQNATWRVKVTTTGGTYHSPAVTAPGHAISTPNWTTRALYFYSDATESTDTCMDRLEAFNTP